MPATLLCHRIGPTTHMPLHAIQRRHLAEELTRLRRADEQQRYAVSQRRGRIDPNPHQIDAVVFALRRIREGGCILADEVGLGKTIEAGLIIAQLMAEGSRRVLLVVPKPLLAQWRTELYNLFGLPTREGRPDPESFTGDGVFVVGREFAGGDKGSSLLRTADPFDLWVIDEAHELFAAIYKRFDRHGAYDIDSTEARTAHRVRSAIGQAPVLLLTATPIQNSLTELWGLVQYVEPSGTLLGKLNTFRKVFCDGDDRTLAPGQAHELKRRLSTVLQRTLRRQAQEFLETPFVERVTKLHVYPMTPEEKELYDDVTSYLLEPDLCAFRGNQRKLLLIAFHRTMASSIPALARSLERVATRLDRQLQGLPEPKSDQTFMSFAADLEDELEEDEEGSSGDSSGPPSPSPSTVRIRAELQRVRDFVRRAKSLPGDGKAQCLVDVVKIVLEHGRSGTRSGKVVVFTESLTTQDYLATVLVEKGGLEPGDVTIFRGQNDSERARAALRRWEQEEGRNVPSYNRPNPDVAVRQALVHEFKTRSKVFISTEAGAKGLNLQFCDTVVNYDLPWNPQRIEQRIGRCHRYKQKRGVTVFNFLAEGNEAQRLTFEILSQKLDLFGRVLDASDTILHRPETDMPESLVGSVGAEFAAKFRRIYERARSIEEIEAELRALRESLDTGRRAFEQTQARTSELIHTRFDDVVRRVFRRYKAELPKGLEKLDRELEQLLSGYLGALAIPFSRREAGGRSFYTIGPSPRLPEAIQGGTEVAVGPCRELEDVEPVHLGHPLVVAAIEEARVASASAFRVQLRPRSEQRLPEAIPAAARGRFVVDKVRYGGFEPVERLITTAILEGQATPLSTGDAQHLLELDPTDVAAFDPPIVIDPASLADAVDEAIFVDQATTTSDDQPRFERMLEQIERYVDDQVLVLRREAEELDQRIAVISSKRDAALATDTRKKHGDDRADHERQRSELEARIERLEAREDPDYLDWKAKAYERRFTPPVVTRVLDVEFVLA